MVEQLCWSCGNACGKCSWSSAFIPVDGWVAEKVPGDTYSITACSEYVYDGKCLVCKHYSQFPIDPQYYYMLCKKYSDSGCGSCRNFELNKKR